MRKNRNSPIYGNVSVVRVITGLVFFILLFTSCGNNKVPKYTPGPSSTITPPNTETHTPHPSNTSTTAGTLEPTATTTNTSVPFTCPNAPKTSLILSDWVMVSLNPPLPNLVRSEPGSDSDLIGQIQPGENVQIIDGPSCEDGLIWWFILSLDGLEGWTAEGDANAAWLVDPISIWNPIPDPISPLGINTYQFREMNISADTAFVSAISDEYFPLATALPTPLTLETPFPEDPRGKVENNQIVRHAEHNHYDFKSMIDGSIDIFYLEDPFSLEYLKRRNDKDCVQTLHAALESENPVLSKFDPFCGVNGALPLHFVAGVELIQFNGGKGLRYLFSSGNYLTVNKLYYEFQGLSYDGKYFIRASFSPIVHPYIVTAEQIWGKDFGPLIGWKEGQYEEAEKSYNLFNSRIEKMLNAGFVPLYPSLFFLDNMMESIVIK